MKKVIMAIMSAMGFLIPMISSAEVPNISVDLWTSKSSDYWLGQDCDENTGATIYVGERGLYVDSFKNTSNGDLYILDGKVFMTGQHIKYNGSKQCLSNDCSYYDQGLAILNTNLYNSNEDIKVPKGATVLHMTTAEKISGAWFLYDNSTWKFQNPFTTFGTTFNYANYASDGTHPATPKYLENGEMDAEIRTITVYSKDNSFYNTVNDNNAIVECYKMVIRRCGDGILDANNEECEPGMVSSLGFTCDNQCKRKYEATCDSEYNGQRLTNLTPGKHLCSSGVYTTGSLHFDESIHKWTWECNNTKGGTKSCWAIKPYCGDGILDGGEQCDPGSSKFGNGCDSNCQLTKPTCTLSVSPNSGDAPLRTTITETGKPAWATYTNINFGDGESKSNPTFSLKHQYKTGGLSYNLTLTVQNNYNGDVSVTKPTATCSGTVKVNVAPYCGDGNVDEGEECDPKAQGRDETTCNSECKKLPVCSSDYNGKELSNLTEGKHLCKVGTYTGFEYNENTHTWTWECEAAGTGVECSAKKPYDGSLDIDKSLTGSNQLVTHTGQELLWQIKVTAKGGDKKDVKIKDYLPEVLTYNNKVTPILPSGIKMESTTPTEGADSSGNYLQWSTEGTLKEGNSIILIVHTIVNTMPKADEHHRNVACAWTDPTDEDCDPEEVEAEGKLKIGKTLTGKLAVEKTGQILTWNVKVTALSGDVENFEIWDIMPNKLSFEKAYLTGETYGIKITKKSETTESGDNTVHYWYASGTLKEGKFITMAVETKVVEMPTSGEKILNVACVIKNNETQDCDPAETEPKKNPHLRIEKYILDGNTEVKTKTVKIGDEIVYKIKFGNNGDADATITSIKDFLPKNVKYKSSEIHINRSSTHGSGEQKGDEEFKGFKVVDGVYIDIYGGLTLHPLDEGYIIIKGEILNDNQDNRTNFACIYLNDDVVDCDDAYHIIVKCGELTVSSKQIEVGSSIQMSCTTAGTGNEKAETIVINCGNGISFTGNNVSKLTGLCIYTNTGTYQSKCYVNGIDPTPEACMINNILVQEKKTEVMCKKLTAPETAKAGDKVTVSCTTSGGTGDIRIDCGNGTSFTGNNISQLNGSCTYTNTGTYHPICYVNGDTTSDCSGTVTVEENPEEVMCEKLDIAPMLGGSLPVNVPISCKTKNGEIADTIVIDCGGYKSFTQQNVSRVNVMCTYYSTGTYHPICYVNGTTTPACSGTVTIGKKPEEVMCKKLTASPDKAKVGEEVTVSCRTSGGTGDIRIDCGNGVFLEGKNKSYLDGECSYNKEGIYSLKCSVNNEDTPDNCMTEVVVKEPEPEEAECDDLYEKNGKIVCKSNIDAKITLYCDGKEIDHEENSQILRVDSDDYKDCKKIQCEVDEDWCPVIRHKQEYNPEQGCFNVNAGNFSIEEGEILPFYWNMQNINNWIQDNDDANHYNEVNGNYKEAPENFGKYSNQPCPSDSEGTIAKDTMVCTFGIYYANNQKLYTIKGPCLMDENAKPFKKNDLLKARYKAMNDTYCKDPSKCYFSYDDTRDNDKTLLPSAVYYIENFGSGASLSLNGEKWQGNWGLTYNKSDEKNKSYGEYQIRIENVNYLQCEDSKWTKKDAEKVGYFTPCESNFVLTNSYTVQKTPSGNLTASTTKLQKYKTLKGGKTFSEYLGAISSSDYNKNEKVEEAMKKFIDKYRKLAVKVQGYDNKYKVPGKNIYFVDGDVDINGEKEVTKPFTMVVDGSATIKGNVNNNMMLLATKNIKFEGNCTGDQKVKGIFYAGGKLYRKGVEGIEGIEKNNDTKHDYWCTDGALHIKGVLIGNNFEGLMNGSRSHLNDWFKKNDSEKKQSVMNGASVLIEYSPSIFTKSTMPPGAEDFTTALSIYKN